MGALDGVVEVAVGDVLGARLGVEVVAAGASRLPAVSGSEARPMRWLESRLAASDTAAATASPRIARATQPMTALRRIPVR